MTKKLDSTENSNGHGTTPAEAATNAIAKEMAGPPLKPRFYKTVRVESNDAGGQILLDGRTIKTPAKNTLVLPTAQLAAAVAAEWSNQGEHIDPASMPLTRMANTAIDAVSVHIVEVRNDIVAFSKNDLLCYRADGPETLAERQAEHWEPILEWARAKLGATLVTTQGVMPVAQPTETTRAIEDTVAPLNAFRLTGLHVITTLTGSAVLALAVEKSGISPDAAWAAAHVDEHFQAEQWGQDAEAAERENIRRTEFNAACQLLTLTI